MLKIRAPRDFFAGLLFMAIGAVGAIVATGYAYGSALRMGPGFLPTWLSWGTIGLGALVLMRSFAIDGPAVSRIGLRPLILVLAAIMAFGLLITQAGLVATVITTSVIGGLAARDMGRLELIGLSLGLAAFCALVFVYGLGQPIELWPAPLRR